MSSRIACVPSEYQANGTTLRLHKNKKQNSPGHLVHICQVSATELDLQPYSDSRLFVVSHVTVILYKEYDLNFKIKSNILNSS